MAAAVERGAVLVTGGAGFIGSHVAEALLARGEFVVVADEVNDYYDVRLKRANLSLLKGKWGAQVRVCEGDLCDPAFVAALFAPTADAPAAAAAPPPAGEPAAQEAPWPRRVDRVVHLAARAGVRPSIEDPFAYVQANVTATTRLLEASRLPLDSATSGGDASASSAPAVKHFVYASSSSVYGDSPADTFTEADSVDAPVSPYAATKKTCELFAHTYTHLYGLPTAGLRFFTVYGPRGRPDMAPFKFVDRVARGLEIQQFGDGSTSRDYTYIDDIVGGVLLALDRPNGYQLYNLGHGEPVALQKFIDLVQRCVGKAANIVVLPPQPGDVERTCANIDKAKAELGYAPRTSFEDGIAKTVAWHRDEYWPQFGDGSSNSRLDGGRRRRDGPPTEELEQWPGGAERRARSRSESLAADQDAPGAAAAHAEQRRLRRLLPRTLPRALPPAATALLASLHLDVRTRAQAAALTPARTAADGDDAARARALNAHSWAGGDFGQGLPPPLLGGPARDGSARPAVQPHTFDEPIAF